MFTTITKEDDYTTLSFEDTNVYSPNTDKELKITLNALRAEANRTALKLSRERRADRREQLSDDLSAINELIDIYERRDEFKMTYRYREILLKALKSEKNHRKAARSISLSIQAVPSFCCLEIGGIIPSDIF